MNTTDSTVPLDQYRALRDGGGFVELAGWSSVTFTGADRQAFLHNFCTNDVKRLAPGQSCEAFVTNVKGKVLGHGLVACREQELVFITVPGQASVVIGHLERYVIREDVALRDTTSERSYLLVGGRHGAELPNAADWMDWNLLNTSVCRLLETRPADLPRTRQTLLDHGIVACGQAAFEALRIEAGTPLFGVDFDASNFPQEVGRNDRAISFTKGCYLGQETVARIDALGHVNQQIAGVKFAGRQVPAAGVTLTTGDATAGCVTSASYSPQLGAPLALAMVRREFLAPGTKLDSAAGPCDVVALPIHNS
jgi:folate-binding protein YgfZ